MPSRGLMPTFQLLFSQYMSGKRRGRYAGKPSASGCQHSISIYAPICHPPPPNKTTHRRLPPSLPAVVVGRQGGCPPCWVVVDNCQRIAGSELLTALLKMRAASGANCGLVMLSAVPWSSGRFLRDTANIVEPARLRFPAYTASELQQVIAGLAGHGSLPMC